ncbi:MAG: DUF2442 domain-containing protein [Candidatus Hydrogenedentes bacterium]|nr:DUF2442 domain-containing protein [Candidatus Hydrogenedentota bacterium]
MFPHVMDARHIRGYTVWVRFDDGSEGEIDLLDALDGTVFEPLRDVRFFRQFLIDGNTLAWPNGVDFAPEFLYERLKNRVHE